MLHAKLLRMRYALVSAALSLSIRRFRFALREKIFNPGQPRVPGGSPDGGQWTDGGGGGGSTKPRFVSERDRSLIDWEKNPDNAFHATPLFIAAFAGSPEEVAVAATIIQIHEGSRPMREVFRAGEHDLPGARMRSLKSTRLVHRMGRQERGELHICPAPMCTIIPLTIITPVQAFLISGFK